MKEYLLKRALPFTLTFALGAAAGGFFQFLRAPGVGGWLGAQRIYGHERRGGCGKKFRRAYAPAAELRPVTILFKPDAYVPPKLAARASELGLNPARVHVGFGHDGKVLEVEYPETWPREVGEAVERAARQIRFLPASVNGDPLAVTESVEIRFSHR